MRWLEQFRVCVIVFLAAILIITAIAFTVVRTVLPYATDYKAEIEKELSVQIGLPVRIEKIDADLHWFSPRLKLIQVSVYNAANKIPIFHFKKFFIELDSIRSLLRGEIIIGEVSLVGVDISIERHPDNRWIVQGVTFEGDNESDSLNEQLLYILSHADYSLLESDIYYRDFTKNKLSLDLLDVNISVKNYLDNHVLELSMLLPPAYGESLQVIADLDGEIGGPISGEFYVNAVSLLPEQWKGKFNWLPTIKLDGEFDVSFWGEVNEDSIDDVQSRIFAKSVSLLNTANVGKVWQVDKLSTDIRFEKIENFWHLNVSDLIVEKGQPVYWLEPSNIIVNYDKKGLSVNADYLHLQDLSQLVDIVLDDSVIDSGIGSEVVDEIIAMQLSGDVYNLKLQLPVVESLKSEKNPERNPEIKPEKKPATNPGTAASKANNKQAEPAVQSQIDSKAKDNYLSNIQFRADIVNFGLTLPTVPMALVGVDAAINFSDNKFDIDLQSEDVSIDFPDLFRKPLQADYLIGSSVLTLSEGFIEDHAWSFSSAMLHLENTHIDTYSRIFVEMPKLVKKHELSEVPMLVEKGKEAELPAKNSEEKTLNEKTNALSSQPLNTLAAVDELAAEQKLFVDVQTDFYDADTQYVNRYLPVGIMSDGLVSWLDKTITNGYVEQGIFLIHGNINEFPFTDGTGVMESIFRPVDVSLKFLDDWPEMTDLSATIKFYNEGMFIYDGIGNTQNAYISDVSVSIADLERPVLSLNAKAASTAKDIQQYVWNSALNDVLGDTLRLFELEGDTVLDLSLSLPLDDDNAIPTFEGELAFIHTDWAFPALEYSLEKINGSFSFTEKSITSQKVSAILDGRKVNLSARTINKKQSPEVVFKLKGPIEIDALLGIYKNIPESWLSGKSPWTISVFVPYEPKDYLVHFDVASSLKGVSIAISDVLSKPKKQSLPVSLKIDVLKNNSLKIDINSDDVMSLQATKTADNVTAFSIESELLTGKGSFTEGLARDTTIVLDLDNIDLYALSNSAENKKGVQSLKPTDLPALDWRAKKLHWDDWVFSDALLNTSIHKNGMLIKALELNGDAMHLEAKGTWLSSWRYKNETVISGSINSENLGVMLPDLGYEKSIDRSKFSSDFNANWRDEPYAVSWEKAKGSVKFKMDDGEIINVDPGASGRLLGLTNIFKLTNRLKLDFDDVYRKGFAFDKIEGEFEFSDGKGKLERFDVTAPAADINMFGGINLLDRDYDLLMRVKPHSDGLTFAGGALMGGVVVGLSLALIQKVLDVSLISHDMYSITGSWDDPKIELIIDDSDDDEDNEDDF